MIKKKLSALLLLTLVLITLLNSCSVDYQHKLYDFTQKNSVFTFREIVESEWDVAYNDIEIYGYAEKVKSDIGEDFSIDNIPADHLHRFLFFKNGKLVKAVFYEYMVFQFPDDEFKFYPNTEFYAEWYNISNNGEIYQNAKIYLIE